MLAEPPLPGSEWCVLDAGQSDRGRTCTMPAPLHAGTTTTWCQRPQVKRANTRITTARAPPNPREQSLKCADHAGSVSCRCCRGCSCRRQHRPPCQEFLRDMMAARDRILWELHVRSRHDGVWKDTKGRKWTIAGEHLQGDDGHATRVCQSALQYAHSQ